MRAATSTLKVNTPCHKAVAVAQRNWCGFAGQQTVSKILQKPSNETISFPTRLSIDNNYYRSVVLQIQYMQSALPGSPSTGPPQLNNPVLCCLKCSLKHFIINSRILYVCWFI